MQSFKQVTNWFKGAKEYHDVIAIQIGTSYTAYAFSKKTSTGNIILNDDWGTDTDCGIRYWRTPSTVLYNSSGVGDSFGFEAEISNAEKCARGDESGLIFRSFPLQFDLEQTQAADMDTLLTSCNESHDRKEKKAIDVYGYALHFIKYHAYKRLDREYFGKFDDTSMPVRWVIVIPAIWGETEKIFMRNAARQAGLITEADSKDLLLASASDCAYLYCTKTSIPGESGTKEYSLQESSVYMLVNIGDDTTRITVHSKKKSSSTSSDRSSTASIDPATTLPAGSNTVTAALEDLLAVEMGEDFVAHLKKEHYSYWLHMKVQFEQTKNKFEDEKWVTLSTKFHKIDCETEREKLKQLCVRDAGSEVRFTEILKGNILISGEQMANFYNKLKDDVIDLCCEKLDENKKISYILLVGTSAESPYVKRVFYNLERTYYRKVTVLVPKNAAICVLRGATIYGHISKE